MPTKVSHICVHEHERWFRELVQGIPSILRKTNYSQLRLVMKFITNYWLTKLYLYSGDILYSTVIY